MKEFAEMPNGVVAFMVIGIIILYASWWTLNEKAGIPGWICLIPFYNWHTAFRLAGQPPWLAIFWTFPLVSLIHSLHVSRSFGRGMWTGIGLFLYVGYPFLAFGKAEYVGPDGGPDALRRNESHESDYV